MRLLKFAFIGCGKIARFHADAVKYLGHDIECAVARESSRNIDDFSEKYGIYKKFHSLDNFIKAYKDNEIKIDCLLISVPWDATGRVLKKVLPIGIPVMTEKPAVLSAEELKKIKKINTKNLFVAYNRRFYDFIPYLKRQVENKRILCVDILSAEPFDMVIKTYGEKIKDYMPYYYTSHVIDLMYYLFGGIEVKSIIPVGTKRKRSWVCNLVSKKHGYPIGTKIFMDCPQNSYIKIFFEKEVMEIKPFERMTIYDSLKMKEDNGRRLYIPVAKEEKLTSDEFKPGFLNQIKFFTDKFVYKKNNSGEYFDLLEKVTLFCDLLIRRQ